MKKALRTLLLLVLCTAMQANSALAKPASDTKEVDICIYGGTSLGVIAAYTARTYGKSVLLVEPGRHLGGMSSGGLGYTDIGNKFVVTGLALDFYRRIGRHYGTLEQWIFEPHVAEEIFEEYVREADIEVWYSRRVTEVEKSGARIERITLEDSAAPSSATDRRVRAKVYIDCSYEGDLMARSGVSYTVGREDNSRYGETFNGCHIRHLHQFKADVDPYVVPGDPTSGLLWGISEHPNRPTGTGDGKVQAYNYRICLTDDPENRIPITEPANYDPSRYELLIRWKEKEPWERLTDAFIWSRMPNRKTDINNRGAFSTDMIGMSWNYPDADYDERARIIRAHKDYTKGLLYFVGHDERIPQHIRDTMLRYGYPKDEYVYNGHWSPQLYVREARRMVGETVMTQHHCQGREVCDDGIAWAAYMMDSHNCDRIVVDGCVRNEGDVEVGGFPPFPISYRAITPRRTEADNLLVTSCISASHIAFGSIRMEPVFMVLGQSAAVAACMAIDDCGSVVQRVDVKRLQRELRENPFADGSRGDIVVDNADTRHTRAVGDWATGQLKCYGLDYRFTEPRAGSNASFRFLPEVEHSGEYDLYYYYSPRHCTSKVLTIDLCDGREVRTLRIETAQIEIKGQTSGEWVSLGRYRLDAGQQAYVDITDREADGTVAADAVLLVPANRR